MIYFGSAINALASEQLKLLQQFAQARTAQRVFRAYLRLALTLRNIALNIPEVQTALRKAKTRIVRVAETTRLTIGLKPILRLLNISSSSYHNWRDQVQNPCGSSAFQLCRKRHTNQASTTEIHRIKTMLENPAHQHWPIRSIAHYALRQKQVLLSPKTWYKYARALGISRKPIPKKHKRISVRASRPDQYWHADVTIFKTADGVRHYIHLIVDNYSRKILAWRIASCLSASRSLSALRDAYTNAAGSDINLIVDGGSETDQREVRERSESEAAKPCPNHRRFHRQGWHPHSEKDRTP